AEIRSRFDHNVLSRAYGRYRARRAVAFTWKARREVARAVYVSEYLRRTYPPENLETPTQVLGCLADGQLFYFDQEIRARARAELGISDQQRCLVYSGGLAHYQRFGDVVRLHRILREH